MKTNWQPISSFSAATFDALEWEWLNTRASLTQTFQHTEHQKAEHRLRVADWGAVSADEADALEIEANTAQWIREMEWYSGESIWMCCRVVIPRETIEKTGVTLKALGETSLGKILFAQTDFKRDELELAKLNEDHPLQRCIQRAVGHTLPNVWARRSRFYFQQQPLLITEVFLPEFFSHETKPSD